ncbi:hypothetical protein HDU67_006448 [Dinochytrium kinnereticum]|nr:hypothetical protein HDU67_006448 [Dinochytrium kinnereticum]
MILQNPSIDQIGAMKKKSNKREKRENREKRKERGGNQSSSGPISSFTSTSSTDTSYSTKPSAEPLSSTGANPPTTPVNSAPKKATVDLLKFPPQAVTTSDRPDCKSAPSSSSGPAPIDSAFPGSAYFPASAPPTSHRKSPVEDEGNKASEGEEIEIEEDYVDEIYDIVDAVVSRSDDHELPVGTFRAWFLGIIFCGVLAAANTLFSFRTNVFYASPFIGVLLAYPCGLFMAATLPTTKYKMPYGKEFTFNPGRFNHKEHALIYVFCNSGANTAYALYNIIGQKYQLYQEDLTTLSCITFAIVTQISGYGLAGLCRRYLVRPAAMLWPSNLSIVALLNSLHNIPTKAFEDEDEDNRPVPRPPSVHDGELGEGSSDTLRSGSLNRRSMTPSIVDCSFTIVGRSELPASPRPGSVIPMQSNKKGIIENFERMLSRNRATSDPTFPSVRSAWGISRFRFYWIMTGVAALYHLLPNYIMPILSAVSVLCYFAPIMPNPRMANFLGSAMPDGGIGLFSLSFDWSVIAPLAPITSPLWALLNQVFGLWLILWFLTPIFWSRNAFGIDQKLGTDPTQGPNGTDSLFIYPYGRTLNSIDLFNKNGTAISARNFVFRQNLTLNIPYYESQRPIYITTFFAIEYSAGFVAFSASLVHAALWYGKDIWHRFSSAMKELDAHDLHARLMDRYPDVPDAWYAGLLLVNAIAAICVCQFGGFDLPWWGVVLGLALAVVSILPIGIIQAISGQQIGLNVMSEFIIGLILPGRIAAVMAFKTLSYMAMYQGLLLVSDLKLGHYVKVPPRSMFIAQLVATVMSSIINVFVAFRIYESFGRDLGVRLKEDDLSSPYLWRIQSDPPLGWTANNYNIFLNAGAIWGAIGPARFFGPGSPYFGTLLGFVIGLLAPIIPYLLHRAFPNSYWHLVNVPLIAIVPGSGVGSVRSDLITPLVIGILMNYFVKKYRHGWWRRHSYVLSAALDSGLAISLTFVFAAFHGNAWFQVPFPAWLLNRADGEVCAPEAYLTCMEHRRWGNGFNGTYVQSKEKDPFCYGINFQGGNV